MRRGEGTSASPSRPKEHGSSTQVRGAPAPPQGAACAERLCACAAGIRPRIWCSRRMQRPELIGATGLCPEEGLCRALELRERCVVAVEPTKNRILTTDLMLDEVDADAMADASLVHRRGQSCFAQAQSRPVPFERRPSPSQPPPCAPVPSRSRLSKGSP